ncbi:MAG TPA: DNA repair protein RadC [Stellaceae bacterium]|jgi:DNA repair protein RadC|nr:DNA repair protein RadC [Stellaceae bacterium]
MRLSIIEQDGRVVVSTPYHPAFPARARSLGGVWDAAQRIWVFDAADHARVRSLCQAIYGTDWLEDDGLGGRSSYGPFAHAAEARHTGFADGAAAVPHYYGHRRRLRERMIAAGAENLPDYELLEMLLFAANPQGDVKPTAKSLLAHFGGFAKVMSAEPDALSNAGLGLAGIAAIKSVREAALRLMRLELEERPVVGSWDKLIDYCNAQIAHSRVEEFHILFLDRKNMLIKHERQQRGTVDHTPVYPREVVKRALDIGAAALILVHNHPSGDPTPSPADIAVTQEIKKAASPLGLALHDHVIIGRNGHASLRDLRLI